jgi:glycosyltransferase involved in cell wall biosynthesis
VNIQAWDGVEDSKFGYGSMLEGFRSSIPRNVKFSSTASVHVYMGLPESRDTWLKDQYRSCFTMWETDTLPGSFIRCVTLYDQIIVPCQHNVDLFSQWHPNVTLVPLGVDTDRWYPVTNQNKVFRFHAGGSLWNRKGLDIVVRAFKRLNLSNAELHIKITPHVKDVPNKYLGDNIFINKEWMTIEEQRNWFSKADVFIAASRGEGFGLMPLQAIAMGIPTIISDSTGQSQFKHLATGVIPCGKSKAESVGKWDEPSEDALITLMLDHYRANPVDTALANVPRVADFSWKNATKELIKALPVGYEMGETESVTLVPELPVRVKRKVSCDIGRHHYNFLPGVDYLISEGVHQVLFDAGVLELK